MTTKPSVVEEARKTMSEAVMLRIDEVAQLMYAAYAKKILAETGLAVCDWPGLHPSQQEGWRAAFAILP